MVKVSIKESSRSTFSTHHTILSSSPAHWCSNAYWWLCGSSNCMDNSTSCSSLSHWQVVGCLWCWLVSIVIIPNTSSSGVVATRVPERLKVFLRRLMHPLGWGLSCLTGRCSAHFLLLMLELRGSCLHVLLVASLLTPSRVPDWCPSWVLHVATSATSSSIPCSIGMLLILLSVSSSWLLSALFPLLNIIGRRLYSARSLSACYCRATRANASSSDRRWSLRSSTCCIDIKIFLMLIGMVLLIDGKLSVTWEGISSSLSLLMTLNVMLVMIGP